MVGLEFKGISDAHKGYFALFFGTVLLLHTLGIFQKGFAIVLIISSLLFIIYGIIESEIIPTTIAYLRKKSGHKTPDHR